MSDSDELRRRFDDIVAAGWHTDDNEPAVDEPAGGAPGDPHDDVDPPRSAPDPVVGDLGQPPWVNAPWRGTQVPFDKAVEAGDTSAEEDEDDDESWTPPTPRALPPMEDFGFWGALLGLTIGPLIILWLVLATPVTGAWVPWFALGLILVGFVLLVVRHGPKDPHDHDDGAVV
ncbi:hypothetical protein [Kribbia dieselivorans]|uniref:hypothetical protein n=1 Tax=Kribbia dieselivorans TaxID=331526 RepID=UPI000838BEAF|nr:hypothetical protein [Kribbia dieselivorans]